MASAANTGKVIDSIKTHRRETFRYIVLPMVGLLVLIIAAVVGVALLPKSSQKSLIADWLLTIMFLCPMVLCLFPGVIVLVAAIAGMARANKLIAKPLRQVQDLSATMKDRTASTTDTINRQTVNASVRLAYLERLLSIFDPPSPSSNGTKEENNG